jgi:hypothetical protein
MVVPSGSMSSPLYPFGNPLARQISFFSTSKNNKKSASNSEPHINDAKARPAEQGLRLDGNNDDHPQYRDQEPESETEKQLRDELSKAASENATLLAKSRDFEVHDTYYVFIWRDEDRETKTKKDEAS